MTIEQATTYSGEAMLVRWGDSSTQGRTVTFEIEDGGEHPFKGLPVGKNGQRYMIACTKIGDDEQPDPNPPKRKKHEYNSPDWAIQRAHLLAGEAGFQNWLLNQRRWDDENRANQWNTNRTEWALSHIRRVCAVESTTEFRTNPEALEKFKNLAFEFERRDDPSMTR